MADGLNGRTSVAGGVLGPLLIYTAVVLLCWMVPLLHQLNAFSMAVLATVAFFTVGWVAVGSFRSGRSVVSVWQRQTLVLVWPLLLFGVALLWAPACGFLQGVLFWVLFPVVTVVFAVAVAYVLTAWGPMSARWSLSGIGVALMLMGPVYDLGFHPQFYTYNHVFGGVLGPIYDETLALRPGLFWFRGLTLCWAAGLLLFGRWLRKGFPAPATRAWWIQGPPAVGALALLIAGIYAFASPLGLNTSMTHLERQLTGRVSTDRVVLHYDPEALSDAEVAHWARYHTYQVERLADRLEVTLDVPVHSFLYPDEATKAALTGARTTNTAPVWLATPQIHVLQSVAERVVAHELAHVASRPFGLPLVRASVSVGLVEGLAVALEPPSGRPSVHDQVVAAQVAAPGGARDALDPDLSADVAARLSPLGFWTGRGAVSYTVMGSFVQYLLDTYGPAPLKQAYAWADFTSAYARSLPELTAEWQSFLAERPSVSRAARPVMAARFARPSVFEQPCPFQLPPATAVYRKAQAALADDRFDEARGYVLEALAHEPAHPGAQALWAAFQIAAGEAQAVVERIEPTGRGSMDWRMQLRYAQALAIMGRGTEATEQYDTLLRRLPVHQHALWMQLQLERALTDVPDVFPALQPVRPPPERAEQLAMALDGHTPGRFLLALALADAQDWEGALHAAASGRDGRDALGLTAGPGRRLQAQVHAHRAMWAYRHGTLAQAQTEAAMASRAFRAMGAAEASAEAQAFQAFLSWVDAPPEASSSEDIQNGVRNSLY